MRRDQPEHAIRAACQIIGRPEVIVVGSQSILGTFREDQLPPPAATAGRRLRGPGLLATDVFRFHGTVAVAASTLAVTALFNPLRG